MRNHKSASVGLAIAALSAGALALAAPGKAQDWQEQGPGPICNGGATLLPDMCDAAVPHSDGGQEPGGRGYKRHRPQPYRLRRDLCRDRERRRLEDVKCNRCLSDLDPADRQTDICRSFRSILWR